MKIKKLNEAVDTTEVVNAIKDAADEANVSVSDNSVKTAANEVKNEADNLNVDNVTVDFADKEDFKVENELTMALDASLKTALGAQRRAQKYGFTKYAPNVIVVGLPGSSKTASIKHWAKHNKLGVDVNIFELTATSDIEAFLNGFTVRDAEDPDTVSNAYSKNLEPLEEPNSVLFLDEYNRQTDPAVRASLLKLMQEHTIAGKEKGGKHYFKNLLFTIIAINPALDTDEGASKLNDAELGRMNKLVEFDSSVVAARYYIESHFNWQLSKLDPKDKYFAEDYAYIKSKLDLGLFILDHAEFAFNGRDDARAAYRDQKALFSQRAFTNMLEECDGDKNELLVWLDKYANLTDKTITMLRRILSSYVPPKIEVPTQAEAKDIVADAKDKVDGEGKLDFSGTDDDEDLFGSAAAQSARAASAKASTSANDKMRKAAINW